MLNPGNLQRMMEEGMIHIGQLIREELRKQGRTVSWFAKQLNFSRSNVYKMFEKPTLDTAMLMQISKLLKEDFFLYYSEEYKKRKDN